VLLLEARKGTESTAHAREIIIVKSISSVI
jgi:hypothetical protein